MSRPSVIDGAGRTGIAAVEHQRADDRNNQVGRRDVALEQWKAPVVGGVPEAHRVGQHTHVKTAFSHGFLEPGESTGT